MMEAMTEFMKQRQHVVVREQRRTPFGRWREVAGEKGYWQLRPCIVIEARTADVHPRATAFAAAGVKVGCMRPQTRVRPHR